MGTALRGRQLLSADGELEAEAHELCKVCRRVWALTQHLSGGSHWKWEDTYFLHSLFLSVELKGAGQTEQVDCSVNAQPSQGC